MPKWPTARLVVVGLLLSIMLAFPFVAEAKRYRYDCAYPKYATPDGLKNSDGFELEFAVDDITGKAVMIGNNGVSGVDAHTGNLGVTFMERLNGGVIQTTIIANNGNSVHSRHTILTDQMVSSQYYGRCSIR